MRESKSIVDMIHQDNTNHNLMQIGDNYCGKDIDQTNHLFVKLKD